jgi:uncharacterized alpha/beta hydrolase family protein
MKKLFLLVIVSVAGAVFIGGVLSVQNTPPPPANNADPLPQWSSD